MDEREEDLETLGEQLYAVIHSKHKGDAGKLTGEETRLITVQPMGEVSLRTKVSLPCMGVP